MYKKSWREAFRTIGKKVRSLCRSKFWKFDPWSHLERTVPRFSPGESNSLRDITPVVLKVPLPQDFLHILATPLPKIVIRSFWPWCDQIRQIKEFWLGEGISLWNFTSGPESFLPGFLPILCVPRRKITNRSFWLSCDQSLNLVLLRCDHGSNFQNFDLERLRTFTPMVLKVSLQDFLPILVAPRPKITNLSFWPLCNQMVLLTGVRPKPGFGP